MKRLLHALAVRDRRLQGLYRRLCRPGAKEWAAMLRERGDFYAMGEHCSIDPTTYFSIPALVRLGNNVRLASCTVFCHDGAVNMLNHAYGLHLDNVGKVDFRDNVYVGHAAIILPGVTIGPNAIVSAGSVVRSDVAEGDVVSGVPARRVGRTDMSVGMMKIKNQNFPWRHLIEQRAGDFDPQMEAELNRLRARFFYGDADAERASD